MKGQNELTQDLRALYEGAGYRAYKMRKFEEYSLYLDNKDFLASEAVITFNDPNGKLLALKPDVTLSIVKNTKATCQSSEKFYYTESVYRMDAQSHEFREINQMGLEMLGAVDATATAEILLLALRSLAAVGEEYVLCLSHMQLTVAALREATAGNEALRAQLLQCIRAKNLHDLRALCSASGVDGASTERLAALTEIDGCFPAALDRARALSTPAMRGALDELESVYSALSACGMAGHVRLDLSMTNDSAYYNGIIFQGYLAGVHRHVLSGGRYDPLCAKFRPGVGAMGFALYLSDLAGVRVASEYDCDLLLLYREGGSPAKVLAEAEAARAEGLSVRVERHLPEGLRPRCVREV